MNYKKRAQFWWYLTNMNWSKFIGIGSHHTLQCIGSCCNFLSFSPWDSQVLQTQRYVSTYVFRSIKVRSYVCRQACKGMQVRVSSMCSSSTYLAGMRWGARAQVPLHLLTTTTTSCHMGFRAFAPHRWDTESFWPHTCRTYQIPFYTCHMDFCNICASQVRSR